MGCRGIMYVYIQKKNDKTKALKLYIHNDSGKKLLAARKLFLKTRSKKQVEKVCEKLIKEDNFQNEDDYYPEELTSSFCWPSLENSLIITVSEEEEIFVNKVNEVVIPEDSEPTEYLVNSKAYWQALPGQRVQRRHMK